MSSETVHSFTQHAAHRFSDSDLRKHAQGATYVKFNDMVAIHLFETSCNQNITVVDDRLTRNTRQLKQLFVKRTWSTRINLLQTEDCSGYGTQFRPTPKFAINHTPTALTWALFGILSSCPALWHAVDAKRTAFRCSRWEGWLLTSVQTNCFQFDTIPVPRQSPFKKIPAVSKLVPLVNACLCPSKDETASDGDSLEAELTAREESSSNGATLSMDDGASGHSLDQPEEDEDMDDEVLGEGHETPANFFRFGFSQFCDLFPSEDYSGLKAVLPSLVEATRAGIDNKKVFIILS